MPFLILGNKIDEEGARKVAAEEAQRYIAQQEGTFLFFETSAKDNKNIEEAFRELVKKVCERQEKLNTKILTD